MKIALVIGHTELSGGAYSQKLKSNEFNYNSKVAEIVAKNLPNVQVFKHTSYNLGYKAMILNTAKKINDFDIVFELHFNASNGIANGSEALFYFANPKGKEIALNFSKLMQQTFKKKNRGAKSLYNESHRGFHAVAIPKPTTIILEPFFGDNDNDCISIENYAGFLINFFKSL
jgi:hypothetical protein